MFGYFLVNPSFTAMSCASFSDEYNMTDPDCDEDVAFPEDSALFFEHEIIPAINRIAVNTAAIRLCISFSHKNFCRKLQLLKKFLAVRASAHVQ